MSDTSQGPGWWLASDGKWYPPELWTGPPAARPGSPGGQETPRSGPVNAAPVQAPGSQAPGTEPPGGPPGTGTGYNQYPQSPQYSGYPQQSEYRPAARKRTNGLAVASFVCAIPGFFAFIPAILAIIFGFIARSQIRKSGGTQGGDRLALAGIIIGFVWVALFIVIFVTSAASNPPSW